MKIVEVVMAKVKLLNVKTKKIHHVTKSCFQTIHGLPLKHKNEDFYATKNKDDFFKYFSCVKSTLFF